MQSKLKKAAGRLIWRDRVLLSGIDNDRDMLIALCPNRTFGIVLCQCDIASGVSRDSRSTYAASSPVTDGQRVLLPEGFDKESLGSIK